MSMSSSNIMLMLTFIWVLYFAVLAIGILEYVLTSLALHRIAKRRQIGCPWLAWIPYGNYWIIGSIADNYDARNGIQRKWRITLLLLPIIGMIVYFIVYISMMVSIFAKLAPYMNRSYIPDSVMLDLIPLIIVFVILFVITIMVLSASQVLSTICQYKIYESTVPEKALKYMIISLLVPLGSSICLFLCRNSGYEVQPPYYQMPQPPMQNMYPNYNMQQPMDNTYQNYTQQPVDNTNPYNY